VPTAPSAFFFYSSCDHRDLHSFPTRRSSDLSIPVTDHIFIVAGLIPNRKSTPVVDEWFGLYFRAGKFSEELTMDEVIARTGFGRSEEHTSELQSRENLVCRLLLEKKKNLAIC